MPTLITRGSVSARAYGFGKSSTKVAYFIAQDYIAGGGNYPQFKGVTTDANNNIYVASSYFINCVGSYQGVQSFTSGNTGTFLQNFGKYWITVGGSGQINYNDLVIFNKAGNLVSVGAASGIVNIASFTTSGSTVYNTGAMSGKQYNSSTYGLASDSANNIYVAWFDVQNNYCCGQAYFAIITCVNSSGTVVFSTNFSGAGGNNNPTYNARNNLTVDSNNYIYLNLRLQSTLQINYPVLIQFSNTGSSLSVNWTSFLSPTGSSSYNIGSVVCDSANNLYATTGYTNGSRNTVCGITKLNSSGTILWSKEFYLSGASSIPIAMALDSAANTYILMNHGSGRWAIVCLNSSGVLQWQNIMSFPIFSYGFYPQPIGITVDSTGAIIISGYYNWYQYCVNNTNGFIFKLRSDGSGTGSFSVAGPGNGVISLTYASSSGTLSNVSTFTGAGSITPSTYSVTAPTSISGVSNYSSSALTISKTIV
jgi:hypothetical protein